VETQGAWQGCREQARYEPPKVNDYGDIVAMTAACQGTGMEDGALKINDPFTHSQPDFGDPGFCQ
jgi:hypothetical protein